MSKMESIMGKNVYQGKFDHYWIYKSRNEYNHYSPLILLTDIVNAKGPNKGKLVSRYGFCILNHTFVRLGKLSHNEEIQFHGFTSEMQAMPGVAKIVWPLDAQKVGNQRYIDPMPTTNKAILGMIIEQYPMLYKHVTNADVCIHEYKQWLEELNNDSVTE